VAKEKWFARKKIIEDLKLLGQLDKIEVIKNKVGFSERTDVVIEPRLSTQWFMNMKDLVNPAIDSVMDEVIKFYPKKMINTYRYWMDNIRDWCISRQLWWGHRIPVFYYQESKYVVAENKAEALILARKESGNIKLSLNDLTQDVDVLDTWFSSWLWPISVFDGIRNPNNADFSYYYPTNDLVTGPDILFFWVARMIMCGYEFNQKPPFKNVYFTGIVRDEKRRKMSKSLGNSPDPIELIDKYGADGVRTAMLFASPAGNDLLFDESLCEQGGNFANKIWNAYRLIDSWKVSSQDRLDDSLEIIDWFDKKLNQDIIRLNHCFKEFRISDCLMILYKLIWHEFCSTYLEIIKPSDKIIDPITREKTFCFFETLLILLHPFMPFITEDIWQKMDKRNLGQSISFSQWPQARVNDNTSILLRFEHLFKVIAAIRKIRKDKDIRFKEKLVLLIEDDSILSLQDILKKTCNLESVDLVTSEKGQLFPFLVDEYRYFIPLTFELDHLKEIERIDLQINYLQGFLNSIEKKLTNSNFMANAPKKEIVMEKKKKENTILK